MSKIMSLNEQKAAQYTPDKSNNFFIFNKHSLAFFLLPIFFYVLQSFIISTIQVTHSLNYFSISSALLAFIPHLQFIPKLFSYHIDDNYIENADEYGVESTDVEKNKIIRRERGVGD